VTTKTYAEPSRGQAEAIAGNTRLLTETFTTLAGKSMPPSRAGMVFLDGFIERQRGRGDEAQLADMAACYFGEALIAEVGGPWVLAPVYGLGVELTPDLVTFPFAKASKHFANGAEDSVLSLFETAVAMAADQRLRAAPA